MKAKYLFAMAVTAGMLAACSSDDAIDAGGGTGNGTDLTIDDSQPAKIQLTAGTAALVSTRGTGTVGDTAGVKNKWNGEQFKVYMFEKGTVNLAQFEGKALFDSTTVYAHDAADAQVDTTVIGETTNYTGSSTVVRPVDDSIRYYPMNGVFDFYGYRLDDAGMNAPVNDGLTVTDSITIDGSQDIMLGKASLTTGQQNIVDAGTVSEDKVYSASAARRGIQPYIPFNHQLTRLVFKVYAGNANAAGITDTTKWESSTERAVSVDSIGVKSQYKGIATIAPEQSITFNTEDSTMLYVKQRPDGATGTTPLEDLEDVTLTWKTQADGPDTLAVGEALLIAPTEKEIPIEITMHQGKQITYSDASTIDPAKVASWSGTIPAPEGGFKAGSSYVVYVKVYGIERIDMNAVLVPWEDGGRIDLDTDN